MSNKIQILIADDHPFIRQGLRQTIESDETLEIVGEAGDGEEGLKQARRFQPQVIVLDIDLPKLDGFQVLESLRKEKIESKVIFLTVHREESFMRKALKLGGAGYVLKDCAVTDIIQAIHAVVEDKPYVSPAMTAYLIRTPATSNHDGLESLTPAERRVLRLVTQYKTTNEIAEELSISPRTVESHRSTITQKLGLRGSHSLMRYALQHLDEIERS
ncbi:MAG TPA: response regulator transcription factor [Pyrinomonadaceae bacterium]